MIQEFTPCSCNGRCCSSVPVSSEEAERLVVACGQPQDEVIRANNHGELFTAHGTPTPEVIGGQEVISTYCVFFDTNTRLCTQYANRPQICKDWECT